MLVHTHPPSVGISACAASSPYKPSSAPCSGKPCGPLHEGVTKRALGDWLWRHLAGDGAPRRGGSTIHLTLAERP